MNHTEKKHEVFYLKLGFTIALFFTIPLFASGQEGEVETITYYSNTQDDSCKMNVYTPPGYFDADTNHYPVLYLMHGGGEDYSFWINSGQADTTLNYYIAHDIAVPMILVMPDGRNLAPAFFANEILDEVIPHIESNYRVIADRDHRGIGGLSFGGMQSLELGIIHNDMFAYVTIMSSGYFSGDNYDRAAAHLDTAAVEVEAGLRYFYFAEGSPYDLTYESGMIALSLFREHGLTVHYWEYSGGHQWSVWRKDFKSFTPYLFRDSTTRYISLEFMGGIIKNSTIMTDRDSLATPPPDPTRKGFTFIDWFTDPEYTDTFNFATDTITVNITLYAQWDRNIYEVSYNANGGNPTPEPVMIGYNYKLTQPDDPTKDGFIFGGWYSDEELTREWNFDLDEVLAEMTLYAKWIDPLGIDESLASTVTLYPNPARTLLKADNLRTAVHADIYSMEGKLVLSKKLDPTVAEIDISSLPTGMYTIVLSTNNEYYSSRFLIE